MRFLAKKFEQLSVIELYLIYKAKSKVFIVEQNCSYLDPDEFDLQALHVMMYDDAELAGYARILPPGLHYYEPAIGRVVVEKKIPGYPGRAAADESIALIKAWNCIIIRILLFPPRRI